MGGGDFGSGSGSKFNCAARVGSGQTVSGTGRVRASVLSPCRALMRSDAQCDVLLLQARSPPPLLLMTAYTLYLSSLTWWNSCPSASRSSSSSTPSAEVRLHPLNPHPILSYSHIPLSKSVSTGLYLTGLTFNRGSSGRLLSAQWSPPEPLPRLSAERAQRSRDPVNWRRSCGVHASHSRAGKRRSCGSILTPCH